MSPLERKVNRGILEHAVGRAITCPAGSCGKVLDARDAVLITATATGDAGIACGKCAAPHLETIASRGLEDSFEVIRGADLW